MGYEFKMWIRETLLERLYRVSLRIRETSSLRES